MLIEVRFNSNDNSSIGISQCSTIGSDHLVTGLYVKSMTNTLEHWSAKKVLSSPAIDKGSDSAARSIYSLFDGVKIARVHPKPPIRELIFRSIPIRLCA